jgi:hypothetical protein
MYTAFTGTGATNIAAIGPSPNAPSPGLLDSFSVVGVVRGSGPVKRRAFLQPTYPGPPACNGLTGIRCVIGIGGQQLVRIEIVSNGLLTLSASPAEVVTGGAVTFAASAGSLALTVYEWIWRHDASLPPMASVMRSDDASSTRVAVSLGRTSQTSASSCQAGQSTCTMPVYEPGVMWVCATVGGGASSSIQAASAPAAAFPSVSCPTGDSLLDLPATRELMKAVMTRTETLTPQAEWAGYVYRLPDGSHRFEVDVNAQDTCNGSNAQVSMKPGWTPVLSVHSHPASPGRPLCDGIAGMGPHGGMLSPRDWDAADLIWGTPPVVPVVVIDPRKIAIGRTGVWADRTPRYDANGQQVGAARFPIKSQFDAAYSSFPRRTGSCERP